MDKLPWQAQLQKRQSKMNMTELTPEVWEGLRLTYGDEMYDEVVQYIKTKNIKLDSKLNPKALVIGLFYTQYGWLRKHQDG